MDDVAIVAIILYENAAVLTPLPTLSTVLRSRSRWVRWAFVVVLDLVLALHLGLV